MRQRLWPLKHLNPSGKFPSGNVRYYYRPKGQKGIRMPDLPPDHPGFLKAYAEAAGEMPRPKPQPGTIAEAIRKLKASRVFRDLAENTKAQRRPHLDDIATRYGHGKIGDLEDRHIRHDLADREGHPFNNRLKAWRFLCLWAKEEYRMKHNAAESVSRAKVADTGGHEPWSPQEIEQFRAYWPIESAPRLFFELLFWTGARISDAIRLGEGHVDKDGWLAFTQVKTGGEAIVPFDRELPDFAEGMAGDLAMLRAAVDTRPSRHITFLTTQRGTSKSAKSVSQWFAAKVREAGIHGRTAHGLRKSRTEALIVAGAGTHQISAWTGHESLSEIERYGKKFNRRKALSKTKEEQKVPTPSEKVPNEAGK